MVSLRTPSRSLHDGSVGRLDCSIPRTKENSKKKLLKNNLVSLTHCIKERHCLLWSPLTDSTWRRRGREGRRGRVWCWRSRLHCWSVSGSGWSRCGWPPLTSGRWKTPVPISHRLACGTAINGYVLDVCLDVLEGEVHLQFCYAGVVGPAVLLEGDLEHRDVLTFFWDAVEQ